MSDIQKKKVPEAEVVKYWNFVSKCCAWSLAALKEYTVLKKNHSVFLRNLVPRVSALVAFSQMLHAN
jgi:hypothetical protein